MSGGSGLKYTASTILFLSKKKDKDTEKDEGNLIKVTTQKSRFTKPNKTIEVRLNYTTGLDRYYGLPDGSKHFAKAINAEPEKFFTEDVMERLEQAAAKEFKYGEERELVGGYGETDQSETDDAED
jgi:hypothetical protein